MTECRERAPPIDNSSVPPICVFNTLTNVETPLLRRICNAGTRLCSSILVPLLQLLEVVSQQGGLIVPAACTLAQHHSAPYPGGRLSQPCWTVETAVM